MPTSLWSPVLTPVAKQYQISDGQRAWEEEKTKALGQRRLLSKLKMSEDILCNYIQRVCRLFRLQNNYKCFMCVSIYLSTYLSIYIFILLLKLIQPKNIVSKQRKKKPLMDVKLLLFINTKGFNQILLGFQ